MKLSEVQTVAIIAVLLILSLFAMMIFPEHTGSIMDLVRSFLAFFTISLSGALFTYML